MDRVIVERKLDSLQRCLARLHAKAPSNVAQVQGDVDLQDVLVLNLSRAVHLCVTWRRTSSQVRPGHRPTPWARPSTA